VKGSLIIRRWSALLVLALLLGTLIPSVALAQPTPDAHDPSSGAICTGDPAVDYSDICGPSLTVPAWSDATGWWNEQSTDDTIQLFDLDGDGSDELIGLGRHGLEVYSWHSAWGQWVPASDPSQAGPFANVDVYYDSIRFGMLADGVAGVAGVTFDATGGPGVANGLATWSWNPGDGSPGSGAWTSLGLDTNFATDSTAPDFDIPPLGWSYPSWRVPMQFVPGGLAGAGHGLVIRVYTGMQFCTFDMSGQTWSCKQISSAFQDNADYYGAGLIPDYYYGTIQLADVYTGADGLELIGRDGANGGAMQVYTWDSGAQTFNHLALSGQTPFGPSWNETQYTDTIRPARYVGNDPVYELVGHGPDQLVYWAIWASGCGGHTAPCWKKYGGPNIQSTPFTSPAYSDPQFYETFNVADLDGDGLDETFARDPQVGFTTWGLHQSWGWYNLANGPTLTSGTSADPLWSNPSYYETIQTGTVVSGQPVLIARGKYGIRTWTWQGKDGWQRPLPYGFGNFATTAEDNAFALLTNYLTIAGGNTIRDSYTSLNTANMTNYQTCMNDSIYSGATMPPTATCNLFPPVVSLANPNNVTAADWKNMVLIIQREITMASEVGEHFNTSLKAILNDLYEFEQDEFNTLVQTLFPSNTPSSDTGITGFLQALFFGVVEGLANFAGPEGAFAIDALAGTLGSVTSLQTSSSSEINTELSGLREEINNTNAAAIQRNSAFFQYVAQDGGLLNVYGALIIDQIWEIHAAQANAAISSGEYKTAEWIYTVVLPSVWNVALCRGTGGDDETCELDNVDTGSTNSSAIYADNQDFYAYLNNPNADDESGNYLGFQLSDTDPTFLAVFGENPSDCVIAGTDISSNWTYNALDGRNCTLAKDIQQVLAFQDPLSFGFQCWVSYAPEQNPYNCGDGSPTGYGPPS